jgi:spermidine/putrescine transport system permease protein
VPYALAAPTWALLGVFFLAPLTVMLGVSFLPRSPYGGVGEVADWGAYLTSGEWLANYAKSLDALYHPIYRRSVWMAVLTTILTFLVSYPLAYYIAILAPRRRKNLLLGLVVVPFWTSFLIRTYAWMPLLRDEGLINTLLQNLGLIDAPLNLLYNQTAVMLGLVYAELPFMILPLYVSLEKLDRTLLEASHDLGAGPVQTFLRVTLPLTLPGVVAGVILVFIPSLGQFVVSDLLGGAKSMLVGNLIQNQFKAANHPAFGFAVAFELMAAVLALLLAYAWWAKRRGEEVML